MRPDYGCAIYVLRERLKLSQRDLAGSIGIHFTYVNHIETGRKVPSLEVLERIAQALGVKLSVLVDHAEQIAACNTELPVVNGQGYQFRVR